MSIKRMSTVWKKSQHKGSDLLLLLALADNADDEGYCWPGVEYLAEKIRMTPRSVVNITARLEDSGELYVDHNRRRGNRYLILTGMTEAEARRGFAKFGYENSRCEKLLCETGFTSEVKTFHNRSEIASSKEPSRTVNEPSITEIDENSSPNEGGVNVESTASALDEWFGERDEPVKKHRLEVLPGETTRDAMARRLAETHDRNAEKMRSGEIPWLDWGGSGVRSANGVSAEAQRRVGWLIEQQTGLAPLNGELRGWLLACRQVYEAAAGDWRTIEKGIRTVWERDLQYRPGHAKGFVDEVRKARLTQSEESVVTW